MTTIEIYYGKYSKLHPGEILQEEFLIPMGISAYKLSKAIGVQQTRISLIIKGERGITADTAMRLSKYFGTTPEFWMNLQGEYDLRKVKSEIKDIIDDIVPVSI
jgi:addiction module HigA family antidote